jgi:hypothetical protein
MDRLLLLEIALAIFAVVLLKKFFTKRSVAGLPPGPSKLPLLQNLLNLPRGKVWATYSDWGKQWGMCLSQTFKDFELELLQETSFPFRYSDNIW